MSELGARLIGLVREVAAKIPDYRYFRGDSDTCLYVRDGAPACIIGHALWAAGLIDVSLQDDPANRSAFLDLAVSLDLPLDKGEVDWLRAAQYAQDRNASWGRAVSYADADVLRVLSTPPSLELVTC